MKTAQLWAAGVTAALALTLTGCATPAAENTGTPPTTAAPQQAPKEALEEVFSKLQKESVKVEQTSSGGLMDLKSSGITDFAGKKSEMVMHMGAGDLKLTMTARAIGDEAWVKISGMPDLPEKWMHASSAAVRAAGLDPEKMGAAQLPSAVVQVERDGPSGFKGTLDLTKMSGMNEQATQALGDKAKAVPFTVKLDDKGRLAEVVLDMNALMPGMGATRTVYSGYGEAANITAPPASEVVAMPAMLLETLKQSS